MYKSAQVKLLSLYSTPVEGSSGSSESLSVCVRSCAGALTEEETQRAEKLFLGTNGLLFYLPPPIESSDDEQVVSVLPNHTLFKILYFILAKYKNYTSFQQNTSSILFFRVKVKKSAFFTLSLSEISRQFIDK